MHLSNIAGVGVPELERNARAEHHHPGTIALRCDLAELRVGLRRVGGREFGAVQDVVSLGADLRADTFVGADAGRLGQVKLLLNQRNFSANFTAGKDCARGRTHLWPPHAKIPATNSFLP